MKKICIIGCSCTAAEETIDEDLVDNYWDFLNKPRLFDNVNLDLRIKYFNHIVKKFYKGSYIKYFEECLPYSWATLLQNHLKEKYLTDIYTLSGSGIDFWQFLYNNPESTIINNTVRIKEYRIFKENILNSDILIWQLTDEPRLAIKTKDIDYTILSVALEDVRRKKMKFEISEWKREVIIDYYESIFDISNFFKEKRNFLDLIITKRTLQKKPTILVQLPPTRFINIDYKFENNNLLYLYGSNKGLLSEFSEDTIPIKDRYCKFGHPSRKCHIAISNFMYSELNKLNLLEV